MTPARRYRFSDRFIRVATTALLIAMGVLVAGGFALGFASDAVPGEAGETLGAVAAGVVVGGVLVPLAIAAVLGGEAVKAGAGFLGLGLVVGVAGIAFGSIEGARDLLGAWAPLALWGGLLLLVGCAAGFWLAGRRAGVPQWLQLPILGSPRLPVSPRTRHRADAEPGAEPDRDR
ncbi:hypothetical protein [Leifsonia sp. NPDC080035]|uniref:Major facilitator superfamily (MFS) profile domain-containing protein n=1 Tax=Leifsonia sp. NPDC080035 TaxID=3143936 RepID=A0AAU7GDX8_9MICO